MQNEYKKPPETENAVTTNKITIELLYYNIVHIILT